MELERIQDFDKGVIPGDNRGSMIMERIQNFDKWRCGLLKLTQRHGPFKALATCNMALS